MTKRAFVPDIIETKESLLTALKSGDIKSSKYNLLNEEEKLFVELVVFGDYSADQAMRSIAGTRYNRSMANRMVARPNVAEALEELSYKRNKKFMAEISSARDMALRKASYIMQTTDDEAVALAASKLILDKAEKVTTEKEAANIVNGVQFNIQMAPKNLDNPLDPKVNLDAPVIYDEAEYDEVVEKRIAKENESPPPTSGLNYSLNYSEINNYKKRDQ